jgi:hypothetical protein
MRLRRFATLVLFLGMIWFARADQTAYDEGELNRLQLEKWKKDASHYARLRHSLEDFLSLAPARQEAMRELDRELREEDSATSARLFGVLDRYIDWLNQLPNEDRQAIQKCGSDAERLHLIRQIRNREWILLQPRAVQEELKRLPPVEQAARIVQLRKREAEFRNQWELALLYAEQYPKFHTQSQSAKFNEDLRFFIKESLEPMLSADEKKQLAENKDKWPLFEMKLVELADKHPVKLPGTGVKTFKDLPDRLVVAYPGLKRNPTDRMLNNEGHWPEYALAVDAFMRLPNRLRGKVPDSPVELGDCRPEKFSVPVQNFIKNELEKVLTATEKTAFHNDEKKWPEYPRMLVRLAKAHNLTIPGMGLPGSRDLWEPFRRKSPSKRDFLPDLADGTLLDFAKNELSAEERADLPSMSLNDPLSREEWKRAYFVHHPEILKQLKRQDVRKEKASK